MLFLAGNRPFTTGACSYRSRPATGSDESLRIVLPILVEGHLTEAVLDTGALYLICAREIAEIFAIDQPGSWETFKVKIRGYTVVGILRRLELTLLADTGENLVLDVTAFVPDLGQQIEWNEFPTFLGLQSCLELMRFAVDPGTKPGTERFFFGPISWDDL